MGSGRSKSGQSGSSGVDLSGGRTLNCIFLAMLFLVLMIIYFNNSKEYTPDSAVYSVNPIVDGVLEGDLPDDEPLSISLDILKHIRGGEPHEEAKANEEAPAAGAPGADHQAPANEPAAPPTNDPADPTNTRMIRNPFRSLGLRDYCGTQRGDKPTAEEAVCELAILYSQNCRIEDRREDYLECLQRIGPSRFLPLLPTKCTETKFFQRLLAAERDAAASGATGKAAVFRGRLKRGIYERAQVFTSTADARYIPPAERPKADFGEPRVCGNGCKHYPLSFSMPASNVVDRVSRTKIWDFLPYVPGQFPIPEYNKYYFSYNDEWLSHTIHRHSMFAFTHRRGGWDCMRHLEILSSGAIPYFADIDNCPRNSLASMPKQLIKEAMMLEGVSHVGRVHGHGAVQNEFLDRHHGGHVNFRKPGTVLGFNTSMFDMQRYFTIADKILEHVKEHMTTRAMVSRMLRIVGHEEPRHVLLIGRYLDPSGYDYIHVSIEHGLSDLGINTTIAGGCRDFVMKMHKSEPNAVDPMLDPPLNGVTTAEIEEYRLSRVMPVHPVAGLIWQYGFREFPFLAKHDRSGRNDPRVAKQILDGEFDLVIYTYVEGEPVQRKPYWNAVSQALDKSRIIFVNHNDDVGDPDYGIMESCRHGTVFKREMHDSHC